MKKNGCVQFLRTVERRTINRKNQYISKAAMMDCWSHGKLSVKHNIDPRPLDQGSNPCELWTTRVRPAGAIARPDILTPTWIHSTYKNIICIKFYVFFFFLFLQIFAPMNTIVKKASVRGPGESFVDERRMNSTCSLWRHTREAVLGLSWRYACLTFISRFSDNVSLPARVQI